MDKQELEKLVEEALRVHLPSVLPRPRAFGGEADFLAQTSDQRNIVVEVKQGIADEQRVRQAYFEIARSQELLGAQTALVVFEGVPPGLSLDIEPPSSFGDMHLVELSQLEELLRTLTRESEQSRSTVRSGRVLVVALPPGHDSQVLLTNAITPVARELRTELTGITTIGPTDVWQSSNVRRVLRDCYAVIADVTGTDPNVMFLFGYALGMNRKVIMLGRGVVPTTVAGQRVIKYQLDSLDGLRLRLREELDRLLGGGRRAVTSS